MPDYKSEINGTTITNTLIEKPPKEYTEIAGEKIWKDDNDINGLRPDEITLRLLRDKEEIQSLTVKASDGWTYSFGELPVDDGYGNTYTYEVREDGVPGYFAKIEGTTVTNTLLLRETPPGNDDTGRPNGDTPKGTTQVENRNTGTPVPPFEDLSEPELEELFDMFEYNTPLWGMMGTGDETPFWPMAFAAAGALALVTVFILTRKRRKA